MTAFEERARADGARLVALAATRAAAFYAAIGYDRHADYFRKNLGQLSDRAAYDRPSMG